MKKFLVFLAIGLFIGIFTGLAIAHIFVQGFFIPWHSLSKPPEKPVDIISINNGLWVVTVSDSIYNINENQVFSYDQTKCTEDCWTKFDTAPQDQDNLYHPEECDVYIPSVKRFLTSKTACESSGPARTLLIYAIDKEGEIYFWGNPIGDMDRSAYLLFPIGIVGFTALCSFLYWAAMYRMEY